MTFHLGVVMDPIANITLYKDSTMAMLLAAQRRGWNLWYMELADLVLDHDQPRARMRGLEVRDDPAGWFSFTETREAALTELDGLLMRKDPPVDMTYIFAVQLLATASRLGCRVVNAPEALLGCNEKLFALEFPECCPRSLVSADADVLRHFIAAHRKAVIKPLAAMGGHSIFLLAAGDPNINVTLDVLTENGRVPVMAQEFIPAIRDGDKRVLMIDGKPVPYLLARLPRADDFRGNLAAGGRGEPRPLTAVEYRITEMLGPELRRRGILFAGLDIIGDRLTEINITSPTCIRELDRAYHLDIAGDLLDRLDGSGKPS